MFSIFLAYNFLTALQILLSYNILRCCLVRNLFKMESADTVHTTN